MPLTTLIQHILSLLVKLDFQLLPKFLTLDLPICVQLVVFILRRLEGVRLSFETVQEMLVLFFL